MTNEQINITIAEACGIISKDQWGSLYRTLHGIVRNCPDYCNDLNAMHEAEKVLDYEQCEVFVDTITDTTHARNREIDYEAPWGFTRIHATAKQRAEAFLRTIGKWEGTK